MLAFAVASQPHRYGAPHVYTYLRTKEYSTYFYYGVQSVS